jgi:two-component sensor histidine kinase
VRAQPDSTGVDLSILSWSERPARKHADASDAERESDFLRAAADWMWETDETLRFTSHFRRRRGSRRKTESELVGRELTSLFRLSEAEDGSLPILTALAAQRRFDDQIAELRGPGKPCYRLGGVPLIDGAGRFGGYRGSATRILEPKPPAPDSHPLLTLDNSPAFGERLDKALRGPLDHIIANAETIGAQGDGPLRKDYAGYATDIATAGRHLLALVDDLVDLQAIERPDFAPEAEEIDLVDVARRAAGLLGVRASNANVRIDLPADDETLPATGEFKRSLQIVMNLLTNAIRYTPEGGQVWIRADREGDLAALIIADQGKGIAPGNQARIFEKFERVDTSEAGGTGLGLYIARRLARAMGGDLAVDSAPGQGSRFTFTLAAREGSGG